MTVRNLLNSGDYVMLVPMGLQITLQYNASGNLEKIYTGFTSERIDRTEELLSLFLKNKLAPTKIQITKGTSWVRGVLYTGELFPVSGLLPNVAEENLLQKLMEKTEQFNFFAGTIESTSTEFRSVTAIRQCLAMAKFRLLPGWTAPYNISEAIIESWMQNDRYTFVPIVTNYIVFRDRNVRIVSNELRQFIVKNVTQYTDVNGYIKARLDVENSSEPFYVDYSDVLRMNIHNNSIIIFDTNQQIIYCKSLDKNSKQKNAYDTLLTCSYCGKRFEAPKTGYVCCTNEHCPSKLRQHIVQFLKTLNMPQQSANTIQEWLKDEKITCIPDLFLLDEYENMSLEISISDLLRALVPISLIPNEDIFLTMAIACNNNEKTFRYYVENPTKISSDLGIQHIDLGKLVKWLSDGYNVSDIQTLLKSPQIKLIKIDRKFDGVPIFRNKTIYLTGNFIRGSAGEIASILQSYSANVTTQFSNIVDCVLVGGTQEEIDGKSIKAARALHKPIMNEEEFFKYYEIDDDLRENSIVII